MIASNDNLLISSRQSGLAYFTRHAAKQKVAIAYVMKSAEFLSECGRAVYFFSQNSKVNEIIFINTIFYESVRKESTRIVDPGPSFRMQRL